jgi:hypothetical protein
MPRSRTASQQVQNSSAWMPYDMYYNIDTNHCITILTQQELPISMPVEFIRASLAEIMASNLF